VPRLPVRFPLALGPFALGLLALGALALPSSARADLPPPDDYVEQCTVDKAQGRTKQTCQSCSAWHGDPDACKKQFEGGTFAHECRAYGASTWSEVWCDPKQPLASEALAAGKAEPEAAGDDAPSPGAGSARGCAVDPAVAPAADGGSTPAGLACMLVAIVIGGLGRRVPTRA
jgi:hypothetical protein